jgi:hypothetical protein
MDNAMNAKHETEIAVAAPRKTPNRTAPVAGACELGDMAQALLSERGEASGVALARQILNAYAAFDAAERLAFLEILAERFGPDPVRPRSRHRALPGPTPDREPSPTSSPPPSRRARSSSGA